jgi:hypothetical protein
VCATSDRDVVLHVDIARDQMVRVHTKMAQVLLDPVVELFQRLAVVRRIAQDDIAVPVQRSSVIGDPLAGGSQPMCQGAAAGTGSDNDCVVFIGRGCLLKRFRWW